MDSHRIRPLNGRRLNSAQISGTNFKTTASIGVGVVILFTGIILIVAFGLPNNISQKPQSLSGTLVCALGVAILLVGCIYAYIQNRKRRKRHRARARLMKVRTLAQVAPVFKTSSFSRKLTNNKVTSSPTQISLVQVPSSRTRHAHDEEDEYRDRY